MDPHAADTPGPRLAGLRDWLFQTGRAPAASFVLGQRQIFILPAGTGILYGAVLVVMYLGAVNYGLGLGHALVFLLAGLGLTGMVHGFRNLSGLRLTGGRAEPVHAGDTAHFNVRIDNPGNDVRAALTLAFKGEPPIGCDVPATDGITVAVPCHAPRRGWLQPPRLSLSTRFPLGLFHAWSYPRLALRCLVYPTPIERPLPAPAAGDRPGRFGSDSGDDDFAGLRNRQPGDPPKHVAWKAYASDPSERPLQVKRFSGATDHQLRFAWDATGNAVDAETRLSILTGWVVRARSLGLRYALTLPGRDIPADSGEAHAARCLEALALHALAHE